jgi:lipopolysaccharide transport system permease protein
MKANQDEITVISSKEDSFIVFLRKIWLFRSLIWVFAKRDLKVKYSQTFIGIGWSVLQPLVALLIYTFFFGYVLNWTANEIPYPVHILSGLFGWNFFTYVVNAGSLSVQESSHIIKKIYFPKSILPFSKVVLGLVDILFSLLLLIPLLFYYNIGISWHVIFLPFVLLFNAICALTLVFWLASLAYKKRDLFHLLPFVIYFGIWFTPVFFTSSFLPEHLTFLLDINPMANVINLWRWMLFDNEPFQLIWIFNFLIVTLFCLLGMYLYNRKESKFSDFI